MSLLTYFYVDIHIYISYIFAFVNRSNDKIFKKCYNNVESIKQQNIF